MRKSQMISVGGSILGLSTGIASAIGLKLMDASLSSIDSSMIAYGGLTVGGGIAVNLLSNTAQNICNLFQKKVNILHPNELNHDLRKIFIAAVDRALLNVLQLYKDHQPPRQEWLQVKEFITYAGENMKTSIEDLTRQPNYQTAIRRYVEGAVNEQDDLLKIILKEELHAAGLPAGFVELFESSYASQLSLCFSEELKSKDNHEAWVAFQKMMIEAVKQDLETLLAGQARIEQSLKEIGKDRVEDKLSRLTPKKAMAVSAILKELNHPEKISIQLDRELDNLLGNLTREVAEIRKLNLRIYEKLNEFHTEFKKDRIHWWSRKMIIAYSAVIVLVITIIFIKISYAGQPFPATVQIHAPVTSDLPWQYGKVKVQMNYKGDRKEALVNENGEAIFLNIPAGFRDDSVQITISGLQGEPYQPNCNPCRFRLDNNTIMNIRLIAKGMDRIHGLVLDEQRNPVSDALVLVQGLQAITDENGLFLISIPSEKQQRFQDITAVKKGYKEQTIPKVAPHTLTEPVEITLFKL